MNQIYFGDCLDVLKELNKKHPDGFIDLVYIDPPFNSKRNYNVLFESLDIHDTKAQKEAFSDTWSNVSYHDTLNEIQSLDLDLYKFLTALDSIRISKSAISYLTTMAIRIWYIHKVLKDTGSFYLHCDPNMSHYLKLVCDLIFGLDKFSNEISWKRTNPKSNTSQNFSNCRDVLLRYTKSAYYTFNKLYTEHNSDYLNKFYKYKEPDGRIYRISSVLNPNKNRPNLTYEFLGHTRVWRWTKDRMEKAYKDGKVIQQSPGSVPAQKIYLDEMFGQPITNDWNDIELLHGANKEFLGYPTQKPIALLERIIAASSNEGDLVADFFCGCGTTIAAAQKLNRNWLGADISHLAIQLILKRLTDPYPENKRKEILSTIEVSGFPKDVSSAKELAEHTDKHRVKFQDWVIEVMIGGVSNTKKTGDGGFDGYLTFNKTTDGKQKGTGLIEVKSGNVGIATLKSFIHVVQHNNADMGVFVCFNDQVTKGMRIEANAQGKILSSNIDKIQIISVDELLDGVRPKLPGMSSMTQFDSSSSRLDVDTHEQTLF